MDTTTYLAYKKPSEKLLEAMIKEEEICRQSEEYRDECTRVKDIPNGWLDITDKMQRKIVKSHGFVDPISEEVALDMLRTARYIFPENEIFKTVPVYVRNNRANIGDFETGDTVEDISIYNIDCTEISLHEIISQKNPTVLITGSHT